MFWRGADRSPFTYAGRGVAVAASDGPPVQVIWSFEPNELQAPEGRTSESSPVWKRGPPPISGKISVAREEGEADVYLLRLEGPVGALLDIPAEHAIIKVGMSANVMRRIRELNAGFPPGSRIRWSLVRTQKCRTSKAAWELEGQYLEALRRNGSWIGGEFALVPNGVLSELLMAAV